MTPGNGWLALTRADHTPKSLDELLREHALVGGDPWLDATGGPNPELPTILRALHGRSQISLHLPASALHDRADLEVLAQAGTPEIALSQAEDPARAVRAILAVGLKPALVVELTTPPKPTALWQEIAHVHGRALVSLRPGKSARLALDAWLSALRETGLALVFKGRASWPEPTPGSAATQPQDDLARRLALGAVLASDLAGWRVTSPTGAAAFDHALTSLHAPWTADLLQQSLAAAKLGARDLPRCTGAPDDKPASSPRHHWTSCTPCPLRTRCDGVPDVHPDHLTFTPPPAWRTPLHKGARIVVLDLGTADRLLASSTLPGLARELEQLGAHVTHLSAWDCAFHPDHLAQKPELTPRRALLRDLILKTRLSHDPLLLYRPSPDKLGFAPLSPHDHDRRAQIAMLLLEDSALAQADCVITADAFTLEALRAHPHAPPAERTVALDLHMLEGAQALAQLSHAGGQIYSCFPRSASRHVYAGLDLRALVWGAYPIHTPHFAPTPSRGRILLGGGNQRDLPQMASLLRTLEDAQLPIDVIGTPPEGGPFPHTNFLGYVSLNAWVNALRTSAFVVIPTMDDPEKPSGISMAAAARAAGRVVIAPRSAAMLDHLVPDEDAILTEPGDTEAIAVAIRELYAHPARLAARSPQTPYRGSTTALAQRLWQGFVPTVSP